MRNGRFEMQRGSETAARPASLVRRVAPRRRGIFMIMTSVGIFLAVALLALAIDFGYTYAIRQYYQAVIDMAVISTLVSQMASSAYVPPPHGYPGYVQVPDNADPFLPSEVYRPASFQGAWEDVQSDNFTYLSAEQSVRQILEENGLDPTIVTDIRIQAAGLPKIASDETSAVTPDEGAEETVRGFDEGHLRVLDPARAEAYDVLRTFDLMTQVPQLPLVLNLLGARLEVEARAELGSTFGNMLGFGSYRFDLESHGEVEYGFVSYPNTVPPLGLVGCDRVVLENGANLYLDWFSSTGGPYTGPVPGNLAAIGTNNVVISNGTANVQVLGDVITTAGSILGNTNANVAIDYEVDAATAQASVDAKLFEGVQGRLISGRDISSISPNFSAGTERSTNQALNPYACADADMFPDVFLDHSADVAHQHGAPPQSYSSRRAIEDDDAAYGDDNIIIPQYFLEEPVRNYEYDLGNRHAGGLDVDRLFLDNPQVGLPLAGPVNPCLASHPDSPFNPHTGTTDWEFEQVAGGGCLVNNNPVILQTGHIYAFHRFALRTGQSIQILGDAVSNGPAIVFVHGNGKTVNDWDFELEAGATISYLGTCAAEQIVVSADPSDYLTSSVVDPIAASVPVVVPCTNLTPQARPIVFFLAGGSRGRFAFDDPSLVFDVLGPDAELTLEDGTDASGNIYVDRLIIQGNVSYHYDIATSTRSLTQVPIAPNTRPTRVRLQK